jgi:hypothetical protein
MAQAPRRHLQLLLAASLLAAASLAPARADSLDSLERDGDVIILTGTTWMFCSSQPGAS